MHAALGALIGELMMGKRLGKRALGWGALFGILPELEVLVFPLLDTAWKLAWHRGPSHSLLAVALVSWGAAQGLVKIWKPDKISKREAGLFVFAVGCVHLLVDSISVQGAALMWPVSNERFALHVLPTMDPCFLTPLVVTVGWLLCQPDSKVKKTRAKKSSPVSVRTKPCCWGLGISAAYVLFAVGLKALATAGFNSDLTRRGATSDRRMQSPTPHNILLWRSVVDRGSELWVGYRSVFENRSAPVRWTIYPKGNDALSEISERPETQFLLRFTDGWWIARPHAKGAWIGDLRLPEARIWGSKKGMVDSRLALSWVIDVSSTGDHLRQTSQSGAGSGESLGRIGWRTLGYRDRWEANPRLAGVPGSLPEFLPVKE